MTDALNFVAKPLIILLCAAALSIILRRSSASLRHSVWMLAIASSVLLPLAATITPKIELPVLSEVTSVRVLPVVDTPQDVTFRERGLKPSTTGSPERFRMLPSILWVLGAAVFLVRFLLGTVKVKWLSKTANSTQDDVWQALLVDLRRKLRVRKPVRLMFSRKNVSPMTWGILRHTILLPATAAQWSEERRRLVLAHELAHVKRHDGAMQILTQIACAVYWFNPLVWYASRRLQIERERACDDHVLNLGTRGTDYADHLVQIARGLRNMSLAAVSMAQPSQLETRLVSILDPRARRRTLSAGGAALLCAFTGLLTASLAAISVEAQVPPPPVSIIAEAPQRTRINNGGAVPTTAVIPPRVLESKPPIYTPEALDAHIEGAVTLEAAVDVKGAIRILRVVKGLGYGLDQRAIGTVLDWRFAPATRNGIPVESIMQVDVDFKVPVQIDPKDGSEVVRIGRGLRGQGVTPPTVISRVEPQYSPEARAARYQGTVVVQATVHKDGTLTVEKIVQALGFGLDEKAIEALEQWKFKPATKNGEPVSVALNVEVNFNLR
jgi:TonB family protein